MGSTVSINLFAERQTGSGAWRLATPLGLDSYDEQPTPTPMPIHAGQEFALYAVLAGVANSFGVAPIAAPRGLPGDVADEVHALYLGQFGIGWLRFDEVLRYDWTQRVTLCGYLDPLGYFDVAAGGDLPPAWRHERPAGGQVVEPAAMQRWLDDVVARARPQPATTLQKRAAVERAACEPGVEPLWTQVQTRETLARLARQFWTLTVPYLLRLDGDPRRVRLLFGFDG